MDIIDELRRKGEDEHVMLIFRDLFVRAAAEIEDLRRKHATPVVCPKCFQTLALICARCYSYDGTVYAKKP